MEMEEVRGSHSTKVEAVVKALLKIRSEDQKSKSLVFSTWTGENHVHFHG